MDDRTQRCLTSILRAAHCRSTHHYFAVDALPLVRTGAGQRLISQLLVHHDDYLRGAKDPDVRFRDFQNHVVHVDDKYWGGAPRVAHMWYDKLQRYLQERRYDVAAHAAGVLSHYVTDPMQPLHTAQSPIEQVLHRPIEWSITMSYQDLLRRWQAEPTRTVFQLSDQPGWLGESILHAARTAHRLYPDLLAKYDLAAARKDPPAGLNDDLRARLSDLVGLAVTGWARILERAAWDFESRTGQLIPERGLTLATVMAGMKIPSRLWLRRIDDREQREEVAALIAEFERDGQLSKQLPAEQRIIASVRKIRVREVEFKQRREALLQELADQTEKVPATPTPDVLPFPTAQSLPNAGAAKFRLRTTDDLVDAPSIGPKTAARFAAIDVHTVADFLDADLNAMHRRLATAWITKDTLQTWRFQATLMCQLPSMLAREVQLLVGAGWTSIDVIARASTEQMIASVQLYADSHAGRRHLRGAEPPDGERLSEMIGDAAMAMVQQKRAEHRQAAPDPIAIRRVA